MSFLVEVNDTTSGNRRVKGKSEKIPEALKMRQSSETNVSQNIGRSASE
jgi:hypothetical protein